MSKTPKKIMQRLVTLQVLAGSESLWEVLLTSVKRFLEKANRTFLVAADEMYGSSLQRRELLPYLLSRPCKRRLKIPQCLKL